MSSSIRRGTRLRGGFPPGNIRGNRETRSSTRCFRLPGSFIPASVAVLLVVAPGVAGAREAGAASVFTDSSEGGSTAEGDDPRFPALDETSTLDDYLIFARENNDGLQAAYQRWQSARSRVSSVGKLPDPQFAYTYFIEPVETRVGPQRHRFALAQTIPWFGKLGLRSDVASQESEIARERYELEKLELDYRVKKAYYDFFFIARAEVITRENMQLLKYWEEVVRARYRAATARHPDVIKAQVELGTLEDRLLTLEESLAPAVAELNAALSRPVDAHLVAPAPPVELEAPDIGEEELLQGLRSSSPALRALAFEITKEEKRIDLAKKSYFPDLTLGFQYIETGDAIDPSLPESGKDAVMATVAINLPIWWNKYGAEKGEARARAEAARKALDEKRHSLEAELKMAFFRYRDAMRKIDLYRDTLIPKGRQSLKATEAAYRAGTAAFLDMIDAQRLLLEFELSFAAALAEYGRSLAEVELIAGIEPADVPTTNPSTREEGRP